MEAAELCVKAYSQYTVRSGGVECLVAHVGGSTVVAFRGTEFNFKDILRDMRGVPWYDSDLGWCHSGFLKGTRRIWWLLKAYMIEPVCFTGHSKGGAEATVAAAIATVAGFRVSLVTFGSPRVGFSRLSEVLASVPKTRYVHGIDCVPDHPWGLWGYRHVGKAVRLKGGRGLALPDRFLDHKMSAYLAAVRRQTDLP